MDKYYRHQLELLREGAKDFALAHPALAPMLLGQGNDPDVERILEGTAYLCGKIQERLDATAPEFITALLQLVYPQALLPLPSLTLMQFTPVPGFIESIFIPAGTQVASRPVDGVQCLYSTMRSMRALPIRIASVLTDRQGEETQVRLTLESTTGILPLLSSEGLVLHLAGDYALAANRFQALASQCTGITAELGTARISLPPHVLLTANAENSDPRIADALPHNSACMQVLRYFYLPQQQLFLRLEGLDRLFRDGDATRLVITFSLRGSGIPDFTQDAFALNTVPAMNIFECPADPIQLDHTREEYPVRAQDAREHFIEILAINRVTALVGGSIEPYSPYESFRAGGAERAYSTRIRMTESGIAPDFLIMPLYKKQDAPEDMARATLSVRLTCCNHTLPSRLGAGDICMPTDTSPAQTEMRNLTTPTPHVPRVREEARLWRFLSYMNSNLLSMASAGALRSLLELHIMAAPGAPEMAAANLRRCNAIVDFRSSPEDMLWRGRPLRGFHAELTLNPAGFVSHGDMHLFAHTLNSFLASFAPVNTYCRLTLTVSGTGEKRQWPPRLSDKPLI